jgi:LacI family transcriptional regulator
VQLAAGGYELHLPTRVVNTWVGALDAEEAFLDGIARERRSAGLILWYIGGRRNMPALRRVREADIPIVFVDRIPDGIEGDFVGTDNENSAAAVTRYLIDLGHRRIGYLTNSDEASSVRERVRGYRRALEEAGIPFRPEDVFTYMTQSGNSEVYEDGVARYFLELPEPATGVCTVNDVAAMALHAAFLRQGQRIPDDISVAGFDGWLERLPGGGYLTTAFQDFERIGLLAARLMLDRIESGRREPYRHILVDAPLRVRASTGPPPPASR